MNEVTVEIKHNEEIIINTRTKHRNNKPVFMMIGVPAKIRNRTPGFPLMETLIQLNKEEQWFVGLLWKHINPETNECDLSHYEFNSTDTSKVSRAFKPLKELGLVKRIKKGIYLINPTAIIPPTTYEDVQARWDSL
jgi:hypothetical protein